MAE
ncbi:hypothetical protein ECPA39_4987, partial [Escherichia coli PA39]|jgi:hypothetical protein